MLKIIKLKLKKLILALVNRALNLNNTCFLKNQNV